MWILSIILNRNPGMGVRTFLLRATDQSIDLWLAIAPPEMDSSPR